MPNKLPKTAFLKELLSLPQIYSYERSPNSKYIAMNIRNFHPNFDVFVLPSDNQGKLQALTNNRELTVFSHWWPDSKSILISQDQDRNERVTVYRVFLDEPNVLYPITEQNPSYYLRSSAIGPNGDYIYYFANYNFDTKKETEVFHLYKQSIVPNRQQIVDIPQPEILISPEKPAYHALYINKHGTKLLYSRSDRSPGGYQWYLINIDGTENREILNFGDKAKVTATWHPDSVSVPFITDSLNGKRLKKRLLGVYNTETEDLTWITQPDDEKRHDFEELQAPKHAPDYLVAYETVNARTRTFLYNISKQVFIPVSVSRGSLLPQQRLDDGRWLGLYFSSIQPDTLVSFQEERCDKLQPADFLFYIDNFAYSNIKQQDLVPAQDFDWVSQDGLKIHGWYYKSPQPSKRTVILVHGGPTAHFDDSLSVETQFYLKQGLNVLQPNYRGSTGYGVEFKEKIKIEGWGGLEQVDIATGADKLIQAKLVEYKRNGLPKIGITGTSYGGYSSWFAITKFPNKFAASAPVCGMTDLVVDYNTTRPDLRPYSEEMMGGSPLDVPEKYYHASPINFIKNIKGKVLIIQGANDPNVTPENVKAVEKALNKFNIPYEKLEFVNEGHGIIKRENQIKKIIKIAEFFDSAL